MRAGGHEDGQNEVNRRAFRFHRSIFIAEYVRNFPGHAHAIAQLSQRLRYELNNPRVDLTSRLRQKRILIRVGTSQSVVHMLEDLAFVMFEVRREPRAFDGDGVDLLRIVVLFLGVAGEDRGPTSPELVSYFE